MPYEIEDNKIEHKKLRSLNSASNKVIRFVFALKKTQIALIILSTLSIAAILTIAFAAIDKLEAARRAMMEFLSRGIEPTGIGAPLVLIPSALVLLTLVVLLMDLTFLFRRSKLSVLSIETDCNLRTLSKDFDNLNSAINSDIKLKRTEENSEANYRAQMKIYENFQMFCLLATNLQIAELEKTDLILKNLNFPPGYEYTTSCGYGVIDFSEKIKTLTNIIQAGNFNKSYDEVLELVKFIKKSINLNINSIRSAYPFFNGSEDLGLSLAVFKNHTNYLTKLLSRKKSTRVLMTQAEAKASLPSETLNKTPKESDVSESASESREKAMSEILHLVPDESKLKVLNSISNKFIRFVFALKKTQITLGILSTISIAVTLTVAFSNLSILETARKALMEFLSRGEDPTGIGVLLVAVPSVLVLVTLVVVLTDIIFLFKRSQLNKLSAENSGNLTILSKNFDELNAAVADNINIAKKSENGNSKPKHKAQIKIYENFQIFCLQARNLQIAEFEKKDLALKDFALTEGYPYVSSCGYKTIDLSKEIKELINIVKDSKFNESYNRVLELVKQIKKSININVDSTKLAYPFFNGSEDLNLNRAEFNNHANYLVKLLSKEKSTKILMTTEEAEAKASFLSKIRRGFSSLRKERDTSIIPEGSLAPKKAEETPSSNLNETSTSPSSGVGIGAGASAGNL